MTKIFKILYNGKSLYAELVKHIPQQDVYAVVNKILNLNTKFRHTKVYDNGEVEVIAKIYNKKSDGYRIDVQDTGTW